VLLARGLNDLEAFPSFEKFHDLYCNYFSWTENSKNVPIVLTIENG
jgi:hypothetical protein